MFNQLIKLSNLIVIVLTGQGINCDILEGSGKLMTSLYKENAQSWEALDI